MPSPASPRASVPLGVAAANDHHLTQIKAGDPGGVLLVAEEGKDTFERAYGAATIDPVLPCQPDTLFAMDGARGCAVRLLALRMASAGKLGLDTPVRKALPVLAKTVPDTTLRVLVDDRAPYISLETILHFRRDDELGRVSTEGAVAALGRMRSAADQPDGPTNTYGRWDEPRSLSLGHLAVVRR